MNSGRLLMQERLNIYLEIEHERARQNAKFPNDWPTWRDTDGIKLAVLTKEIGEVAKAILEKDNRGLYMELVQVAAVAVKWLEAIEYADVERTKAEDALVAAMKEPRND